jgi:hypothetical protein
MGRPGHHIMFSKAVHNSQTSSKTIRNNRWLIVPLKPNVHGELHRNVGIVPVMSWQAEARVARDFYPVAGNYVKTVEALARVVHDTTQQPNISHLEQALGLLVIEALELQLEYISPENIEE